MYRQWLAQGAQVRRGEKAATIVFYKSLDRPDAGRGGDASDKEEMQRVARASFVFNAAQVDGWTPPQAPGSSENNVDTLVGVETFIGGVGATILEGGGAAFYKPSTDTIHVPDRRRFFGTATCSATEAFYSTVLHELVHWTGHSSRLNRDLTGYFGAMAYAMEELVAEIGAAYLCADLGVSVHPREDHAMYVASWIRVLKEQSWAIVAASRAATTACG